jgi:AcrR family transcriptional regulator
MTTNAEKRRRAILDAALRLFGEQGHDATTMSDIVADVGGSKATLYKYFPSKEALLHEVVETSAIPDFVAFDALLDGDAPIAERIRAFVRAHLAYQVNPKVIHARRLLAFEVHRSQLARRLYETSTVPAWRLIAASLSREMDRGALRKDDPWLAVMFLKALIDGYIPALLDLDAIDPPSDEELRATADAAADVFARAYAPSGEPSPSRRVKRPDRLLAAG